MTRKSSLEDLRKEITEITLEILRLCGERLRLAQKIAEIKATENLPIENLRVEDELRKKVLGLCETYGVDRSFGAKILELLLDESKRVQRDMLKS